MLRQTKVFETLPRMAFAYIARIYCIERDAKELIGSNGVTSAHGQTRISIERRCVENIRWSDGDFFSLT